MKRLAILFLAVSTAFTCVAAAKKKEKTVSLPSATFDPAHSGAFNDRFREIAADRGICSRTGKHDDLLRELGRDGERSKRR